MQTVVFEISFYRKDKVTYKADYIKGQAVTSLDFVPSVGMELGKFKVNFVKYIPGVHNSYSFVVTLQWLEDPTGHGLITDIRLDDRAPLCYPDNRYSSVDEMIKLFEEKFIFKNLEWTYVKVEEKGEVPYER